MRDLLFVIAVLAGMAYAHNQQFNEDQRRDASYQTAMGRVR